jgi:Tfp pilus assembly protein PilF
VGGRAPDELDRAVRAAAELVERKPEFCRGWEMFGVVQRRRGEAGEARKSLERALACDAQLKTANLELARLLQAAGEKDAAAERYRRYVELGGQEPLAPR